MKGGKQYGNCANRVKHRRQAKENLYKWVYYSLLEIANPQLGVFNKLVLGDFLILTNYQEKFKCYSHFG